MIPVFKRTFRSLWRGWVGWAFAAVLLLATGISAYYYNLYRGYATFSGMFSVLAEALIPLAPVAACAVFTRARRTGEAAWFRSLPISGAAYYAGQFLALLAVFFIPAAIAGLLPLLFSAFGSVSFGAAYVAWLGYLLHGAAMLAVCSFIASRTDRRALSVGLGMAVCVLLGLTDLITGLMERAAWGSALVLAVLFALAGLCVWFRTGKRRLPAVLTFAVPTAAAAVLIFAAPRFLTDRVPAALHLCSPFARFSGFLGGHFDLPAFFYDLSVIGFFLFLTVWRASLRRDTFRRVAAACAAAVLLAGMNAGLLFLPFRAAYPDVTGRAAFRLSAASRGALSALNEDVTIRYLSGGGKTDVDRDLYSLAVQYAEASPHVRVEVVNLSTDPRFRDVDAEALAYADQGVIVSGRRSRMILRAGMYYYLYTMALSGASVQLPLTPSGYQELLVNAMSDPETFYGIVDATTTRFALESMMTNAIFYASAETAPRIAMMGDDPDHFLQEHLLQSGFGLETAAGTEDLAAADAIFCSLTSDLTNEEAALLGAYLSAGGRLLLTADSSVAAPNLVGLLNEYGIFEATEAHVPADGSMVGLYGMTADAETENGGRLVFVAANVTAIVNAYSGGGDFAYLTRALNWLTDFEGSRIPVDDPILPNDRLSPKTGQATFLGVLLILLVPAATVALGAVLRYVRKQKTGW